MVIRLIVVIAIVGAAWALLAVSRRTVGRRVGNGLTPGLTLFVGPDCAICPRARDALEASGAVIYDAITAPDRRFAEYSVRSVPTALVVDIDGSVTMRRAGPAVVSDAPALVAEHRRIVEDPLADPV